MSVYYWTCIIYSAAGFFVGYVLDAWMRGNDV